MGLMTITLALCLNISQTSACYSLLASSVGQMHFKILKMLYSFLDYRSDVICSQHKISNQIVYDTKTLVSTEFLLGTCSLSVSFTNWQDPKSKKKEMVAFVTNVFRE